MTRSRQEWERIVAEFQRSGTSQVAFSKRRGIALSTLQYWVRKLRDDGGAAGVRLLPVRVRPESPEQSVEARVADVAVRFSAGTSPEYIAAVLRALSGPC